MMAQTNHDEFDDELLSAYVDGELTAAERALVEERLRSDPAAAALVEELRSLSSAIKALPRETLGRDLRAGVLAEIEQARIDLDLHGPATLPMEPVDRRQGIRRGLVWSALAIAATLAIALFQPAEVEQEGRDLARAEKRETENETLQRPERRLSEVEDSSNGPSTDKFSKETRVADADALPPGLRGSMSSGSVDGAVGVESEEETIAAVQPPAPAPEASAPMLAEAAPSEEPMLDGEREDAMYAAAPAVAPLDATTSKDALADREQASDEAVMLQDSPAPPESAATPLAASQPSGAAGGTSGAPMAMGGGGAFGPRGGEGLHFSGAALMGAAREGDPATVMPRAKVTLKLASTEGAARFEQLLAESDIAPAEDAKGKEEVAGERFQELTQERSYGRGVEDAKQDAASQQDRSLYFFFSQALSPPADAAEKAELGVKLDSIRDAKQSASNFVWVEATPAQIDALLEKCRNDKKAFVAVLADEDVPLAKKTESASKEMKLKRLAGVEETPDEPESDGPAGRKRERVLFVLEPATPAVEATASPETSEAR